MRKSCSGSPRADTMRMSAASRPARCHRAPPTSTRKASTSTTSSSWTADAFCERELYAALKGAKYPRAQSIAERQRSESADRRQRKGRARAAKDDRRFRLAGRARLYGPRAGQRRRERAPRARPPARQRLRIRDGPGHLDPREDFRRQSQARSDRRFHRHLARAADELQRARARHARRRALRLPRHGRRRNPDERRLPAPDQDRDPAALDALARIPRGGGGRQRRDQPGRHRLRCSARSRRSPPRKAP